MTSVFAVVMLALALASFCIGVVLVSIGKVVQIIAAGPSALGLLCVQGAQALAEFARAKVTA